MAVENFPLPTFQFRLRDLAQDLHHGKGFFILRGLDPQDCTSEDNALIFLGISSYIAGHRGRQDAAGNMLGEKDINKADLIL